MISQSFYCNASVEQQVILQRKRGLMLKLTGHQFLWRSRSCSCLTLLCTTVLCSPQWQETPKLCTKTFGAKTTEYSTTSARGSHTLLDFSALNLHIFDSTLQKTPTYVKPGLWWWLQHQSHFHSWIKEGPILSHLIMIPISQLRVSADTEYWSHSSALFSPH